jgi:hypothetical protein
MFPISAAMLKDPALYDHSLGLPFLAGVLRIHPNTTKERLFQCQKNVPSVVRQKASEDADCMT